MHIPRSCSIISHHQLQVEHGFLIGSCGLNLQNRDRRLTILRRGYQVSKLSREAGQLQRSIAAFYDKRTMNMPVPAAHNLPLYTLEQVHSDKVIAIDSRVAPAVRQQGDALITAEPGVALLIRTADCNPILLWHRGSNIVAAVHAGWRGAAAGIIDNTVAAMIQQGAEVRDIVAVMGPSIQQSNYEVQADFYRHLVQQSAESAQLFKRQNEQIFFDLPAYCLIKLQQLGVARRNIGIVNIDTYEHELFFSHRRYTHTADERHRGRQFSYIMSSKLG